MKIIKTASGSKTIKMSKEEWKSIGKTAGWMKIAEDPNEGAIIKGTPDRIDNLRNIANFIIEKCPTGKIL